MTDRPDTGGPRSNRPFLGILSLIAGVSIFSIQDAFIKRLSDHYPVHQIVFVRSLVAVLLLVLFVALTEGRHGMRTRRLALHALRGVALFTSYMGYYLGLASMSIAEAIALFFTVPFFVAALSNLVIGEPVGPRRWAAIVVGFSGVVIVLRPGTGVFEWAACLPVFAALTYAVSALFARRLGSTESGGTMALSAAIVYAAASGLLALAVMPLAVPPDSHASLRFLLQPWASPGAGDFGLMLLCGVIAAVGSFFLGQAYRLAEANTVAPFEYAALPWGVLWGWIFFANLPDRATMIGGAVIVASGLYILHRERRQRRRTAAATRSGDT
jgi:drug/metabolite transporter (DMT)-like permease